MLATFPTTAAAMFASRPRLLLLSAAPSAFAQKAAFVCAQATAIWTQSTLSRHSALPSTLPTTLPFTPLAVELAAYPSLWCTNFTLNVNEYKVIMAHSTHCRHNWQSVWVNVGFEFEIGGWHPNGKSLWNCFEIADQKSARLCVIQLSSFPGPLLLTSLYCLLSHTPFHSPSLCLYFSLLLSLQGSSLLFTVSFPIFVFLSFFSSAFHSLSTYLLRNANSLKTLHYKT